MPQQHEQLHKDLGRSMWSLRVHIPAAHDSSSIVDASHLRCSQPAKAMSLASIAEEAIWACNAVSPASNTHVQFTTHHYPIATSVPALDREVWQVLQEVRATAQDELKFQDWKARVIASRCQKVGIQK